MKKLLAFLLSFFCFLPVDGLANNANQANPTIYMGFFGNDSGFTGINTQQLNSAAKLSSIAFMPTQSKTISEVWYWVDAVGGTLGSSDIRLDIYSNSAGSPGTTQANSSTVSATPTGASLVKTTGFSYATTAGTLIWFVWSNAAADPTTNNYTITDGCCNQDTVLHGSLSGYPYTRKRSTDTGASWGANTQIGNGYHVLVKYSDNTYEGIVTSAYGAETTNQIYSAREYGNVFTSPPNARINISGISFFCNKSNNPTGNLQFRLYKNTTLVGTTAPFVGTASGTSSWIALYFATPIIMEPNTTYRAVISETTQSDTSTNAFRGYNVTVPTDAVLQAQQPFNGTMHVTYLNGTWDDSVTTKMQPMVILGNGMSAFAGINYAFGGSN